MNKFVKIITTAGSAALIISGTALADPPAAFDTWSVTSGTVNFGDYDSGTAGTQTCPAGYTCGTPVTGSGFVQRQVVNNTSGVQYFQTIVAPEGATGAPSALAFADETFVRVGSTGVAGKQHALDSSVSGIETTDVSTSTILNSGWATGGAYKDLQISQSITLTNNKSTTPEVTLYNGFTFNQNGTNAAPTGKFLDVTQGVLIDGDATIANNTNDDVQKFVMRQASGNLNGSARTLGSTPAFPGTGTQLLPGNSTDLAWAATDDVKVIWVGQQMIKSGVESFRYQFYDNVTSAAADSISDFEVGAATPFTWVNPFSTLPGLTVP